jgi:hypothetical protein
MKYLILESRDFVFLSKAIIGRVLKKLISNPNQQLNQELEEIEMIVPRIIRDKNTKINDFLKIKKGFDHIRGMGPIA